MIDHQIDEEMILIDEVSDEAVEAADLVALEGLPTLPNTYCFAMSVRSAAKLLRQRNRLMFCELNTA